jgi:hypothetical protein
MLEELSSGEMLSEDHCSRVMKPTSKKSQGLAPDGLSPDASRSSIPSLTLSSNPSGIDQNKIKLKKN